MGRQSKGIGIIRLRAIAAISVAAMAVPVAAAATTTSADSVGRGTFTTITSPSKDLTYQFKDGATNSIRVTGHTSLDVTLVDIDCITSAIDNTPEISLLASNVSVTDGRFTVNGVFASQAPITCRLRAIPADVDVEAGDYIGSFTGPIIYPDSFGLTKDESGTPYSFTATAAEGGGFGLLTDAGACGAETLISVQLPAVQVGPIDLACGFNLASFNVTASGTSNGSAIQVSGHSVYLPDAVHTLLVNQQHLGVKQSKLTVVRKVAKNGDVTITESAPLMRCSVSDFYPPTSTSCPKLISSGVSFKRVSTVLRGDHQVKVRDSYSSTDHRAHPVKVQYLSDPQVQTGNSTATGQVGYTFPGHGNSFTPTDLGQSIKGLGSKIGTMAIRGDIYARSDDPDVDTITETWSRGPAKILYSVQLDDEFAMPYSFSVPARGSASLGFAMSERVATADVRKLASAAAHDMLPGLTVTSPHGVVHGKRTTVKGRVVAGANGLPASVRVNGHAAKIHATKAGGGTYSVTFSEPKGTHTVTVAVSDVVGNTVTKSITIKNT
jgi:hypothetical protein